MAKVSVENNIKANRLLRVDEGKGGLSLAYATSKDKVSFNSLVDINKGRELYVNKSTLKVWNVELERAVKKGEEVMVGTKGMVKSCTKDAKSIGIALEKGVKGDVIKIKKHL